MGSWKIERDVKVADLLKDGVKTSYEIGFGTLFAKIWSQSISSLISSPVLRLGLKAMTGLAGAAYGKVLYDFVDDAFDIEEKIDKVCGSSEETEEG